MTTQVIGITRQSASQSQILTALEAQHVALTTNEIQRGYAFCDWLQVDMAFVCALWLQEGQYGHAGAMVYSRCPINIKAAAGEWRPTVAYQGSRWLAFETWQLGLFASVLHLKNIYGASNCLTVEQIISIFAPASDGNAPTTYIQKVLAEMTRIQQL